MNREQKANEMNGNIKFQYHLYKIFKLEFNIEYLFTMHDENSILRQYILY